MSSSNDNVLGFEFHFDRLSFRLLLVFTTLALASIAILGMPGCNAVEGIARDLSGMSHGMARTLESNGQN